MIKLWQIRTDNFKINSKNLIPLNRWSPTRNVQLPFIHRRTHRKKCTSTFPKNPVDKYVDRIAISRRAGKCTKSMQMRPLAKLQAGECACASLTHGSLAAVSHIRVCLCIFSRLGGVPRFISSWSRVHYTVYSVAKEYSRTIEASTVFGVDVLRCFPMAIPFGIEMWVFV